MATALGACSAASAPAGTVRWDVTNLSADGKPLRGQPVDLIGVGDSYVGLVKSGTENWFVTSNDGRSWRAFQPQGLPSVVLDTPVAPGGLNAISHVLFTDGDAVYLRVEAGSSFDRLGSVALYVSNADARAWKRVRLPAAAGKGAFPIAATSARGRRYLAGAVYDPRYGQSYLEAAVWVADGNGAWRSIDAPAFAGNGNQTIFSLAVLGKTVVAGGGDGALLHTENCCYYPYGIGIWRSTDRGDVWKRANVNDKPYPANWEAVVVGFRSARGTLRADVAGFPRRIVQSRDLGATWTVATKPPTEKGVIFPRVGHITPVDHHFVATTEPAAECIDCTRGSIALSDNGTRWHDVTPKFPCGIEGRSSYGFVSSPIVIGKSVAVLGACGDQLSPFNETLLAVSSDSGVHWEIRRHRSPTGGPIPAVAAHGQIVTLAAPDADGHGGQIRAVVAH